MNKISIFQIIIIVLVLTLFVFGKVWVARHPKSMIAIILGAILLIVSEPATAGG